MTRKELFEKYHIREDHQTWKPVIDNWMSVEVYRAMHNGNLPSSDDTNYLWILEFHDKAIKDPVWFFGLPNHGSLFLTTKRMIYQYADKIIEVT